MAHDNLLTLANDKNWGELEQAWLAAIDDKIQNPAQLLAVIDEVVAAGKNELAATLGWAWLSSMKENHSPREALQLGRGLLLRLPDGDQLREEILQLYKQTHSDAPDLEKWIDRSGLQADKSVRRALRFLDTGLRLQPGAFLIHRTEDVAAQVVDVDLEDDVVEIKTPRRTETHEIDKLIEEYESTVEHDFRVLAQLQPEKLEKIIQDDPLQAVIGILIGHKNQIDRDELKLLLVSRYVPANKWSDWWSRVRNGVKKSKNLRIEGRSPMFLIYDPVGKSLEEETWSAFKGSDSPREWLEDLEAYLKTTKQKGAEPDPAFIEKVQNVIAGKIDTYIRHKEWALAFSSALVIERVAMDGLPVSTDVHGTALEMLKDAGDPVKVVAALPDARLWPIALRCIEQAFPEKSPDIFAELILYCPPGQCDTLAKAVEQAGREALLPPIVERALADPGQYTDAAMWIWKDPAVKTDLPIPSNVELLTTLLTLAGPSARIENRISGQSVADMRAKIRNGLPAKNFAKFKDCLKEMDVPMARAVQQMIMRADGLGPRVQSKMGTLLRQSFPKLYEKPKVAVWEDESVLYFTEAGLKQKEAEVDELVNVKMRENAKAIGEAASHGDLSENSEYKFALEERDLLRARLAQLNRELGIAKVLKPDDVPIDQVSIGQRITLLPTNGGHPTVLTVMGAGDSDSENKIYSYKTPVAQSLMGSRVGDAARLSLDGNDAEYKIEQIERAV